ncbi:hypothetical protein LINPERHAP2_LOCUS14877 [Linum perenne]
MFSSPLSAGTATSPATIPTGRPPETEKIRAIPPVFSPSNATTSAPQGGTSPVSDQPLNKSYLGVVRGHETPPLSRNQEWIPVGENDIILSASNGIKSLNLSSDFKAKLCKPWSNSVIVRLLGKSVGYSYLCHRLKAIWKPVGNLHIVDLDKDCFMIKFAYEQDYFRALTGGP